MSKLFEIELDYFSVKEHKHFIVLKFPAYLGCRITRDLSIKHSVVIPFGCRINEYGVVLFIDHSDAVAFANRFISACGKLVDTPYEYIIDYTKGDL